MIYSALKCVADGLNSYIRNRFSLVKDKVTLSSVMDKDNSSATDTDKITITLVNIQQEKTVNRNGSNGMRAPMQLNLYLLFTVYFGEDGSYEESLKELAAVMSFFQSNNVMSQSNTPDLDNNIEKLVFEFINQDMQALNNMWSMLGGKFAPSALYQVRMVTIQEGITDSFSPPFTGFSGNTTSGN